MNRRSNYLLALALLFVVSCSSEPERNPTFDIDERVDASTSDASSSDAGSVDSGDSGALTGLTVDVLGEGEEVFDDRTHSYQLLRLTDHDSGVVTYAQWNEPDGGVGESNGVMVFALPYVGIDWSGEEVDERWAAKGEGLHPDEDSPDYDPATSSPIAYAPISPREGVDRGMLFLVNDIPTLMVFGRFYAGGDIQNEVDDMVAGLKYLEQREDIDSERIGINGGSWGGFEALYAAANAPDSVRPTVGLALYPLSDFALEWQWSEEAANLDNLAASRRYQAFFDPYRRRIAPITGGAPDAAGADYSGFTHDFIGMELETPFIIIHDEHDVLVPFTQARALRDTLGADAQYVWFRQPDSVDPVTAPLGHGQTANTHLGALFGVVFTPIIDQLAPPNAQFVFTIAQRPAFIAMLEHFNQQASRGQSLYDLNSLLADMAAPRVQVFELDSMGLFSGAQFVADTYNEVFGTNYTAADVADNLRNQ